MGFGFGLSRLSFSWAVTSYVFQDHSNDGSSDSVVFVAALVVAAVAVVVVTCRGCDSSTGFVMVNACMYVRMYLCVYACMYIVFIL